MGLAVYQQTFNASAILWIKEKDAPQGNLICTFEGLPEDVQIEANLFQQIASAHHPRSIDSVAGRWIGPLGGLGPLRLRQRDPGQVWCISRNLPELIRNPPDETASGALLVDIANGCLYLGNDDRACLAGNALRMNGYAIDISKTPPDQNRIFKDRRGNPLVTALKQRWDPSGISTRPLRCL